MVDWSVVALAAVFLDPLVWIVSFSGIFSIDVDPDLEFDPSLKLNQIEMGFIGVKKYKVSFQILGRIETKRNILKWHGWWMFEWTNNNGS